MRYVFILALLIFYQLANGQTDTEDFYIKSVDCLRQSFPDNGVAYDHTFNTFEAEFLELNNMKDNSGKSYRAFLENIVKNKEVSLKLPSPSTAERRSQLGKQHVKKVISCMRYVFNIPENVNTVLNFHFSNYLLDDKVYITKLAQTLLDSFTVEQMGQQAYQITILGALEQVPE